MENSLSNKIVDKSKARQMNPKVGIIILNYNGFPFIKECLNSVAEIDYPNTYVVIVDNGSIDSSLDWIREQRYANVHIIALSENKGFSEANNEGIRWALSNDCGYVLLLNNDTVVNPDFLSRIMDHADLNSILVPKIYRCQNKQIIDSNVGDFDFWRGVTVPWFYGKEDSLKSQQVQQVDMVGACAVLISKNIFLKVGFLDENFFLYWEDTDFIVRAKRKGFISKFVPAAIIYHNESSSSGGRGSPLAIYYNSRNRLYFMFKHQRNIAALIFFLFYYFMGRVTYIVFYALKLDIKRIKAVSFGILDFFMGKMGKAPIYN